MNPNNPTIREQIARNADTRTIICFAFRYSLSRKSYAGSLVQDYIKDNIDLFFPSDLSQMADEIDEQARWHDLGDPQIDEPQWRRFQAYLREKAHELVLKGGHGS